MKKLLSTTLLGSLLLAGLTLTAPMAQAQADVPAAKKVVKAKPAPKKAVTKKAAPAAFELAAPDDDDTGAPIDAEKSLATDYQCELGNQITIFRNEGDDRHIALRWQKVLTRMQRVGTTTGANRFENRRSGLVWIGIPAKGMLLDSKKGQQLANECKDPEQRAPKPAAAEPVKS